MPGHTNSALSRIQIFLTELFRGHDDFRLRPSRHPLPSCTVRVVREEDHEACEAIYRLNEGPHFPPGYFERFRQSMRGGEALYLALEVDGVVRAFGGISQYATSMHAGEFAGLMFGMVHPEFHRRGYGTILLLARLALLGAPKRTWIVLLSSAGGSETFYDQFGFSYLRTYTRPGDGVEHRQFYTKINGERNACRRALKQADIVLDLKGAKIPIVKPPPEPGKEGTSAMANGLV